MNNIEAINEALEQRVAELESKLGTAQTRVAMLEFAVMNLQDEMRKIKG